MISQNAWSYPVAARGPQWPWPVCASAPLPAPVSAAPRAVRSTPGASEVGPAASACLAWMEVGSWTMDDILYIYTLYIYIYHIIYEIYQTYVRITYCGNL